MSELNKIKNRVAGISSVLREFRTRLDALEQASSPQIGPGTGPQEDHDEDDYAWKEVYEESWRKVYGFNTDPQFDDWHSVDLAKQVIDERKRADGCKEDAGIYAKNAEFHRQERDTLKAEVDALKQASSPQIGPGTGSQENPEDSVMRRLEEAMDNEVKGKRIADLEAIRDLLARLVITVGGSGGYRFQPELIGEVSVIHMPTVSDSTGLIVICKKKDEVDYLHSMERAYIP